MARIVLGIGTSHTPMLNAPGRGMAAVHRARLAPLPHHKDGRAGDLRRAAAPGAGLDARPRLRPSRIAARHDEAKAAIGRLGDAIRRAELDALIVVGDDQKEIYHDDNMPSVLVYRGETIANVPNRTTRDFNGPPDGRGGRPRGTTRRTRRGTIRSMPGSPTI